MAPLKLETMAADLSDVEKDDLDTLIADYRASTATPAAGEMDRQARPDGISQRLDTLLERVAAIDGRLSRLTAMVRRSRQQHERLNQRIETIIAALRKGHEK